MNEVDFLDFVKEIISLNNSYFELKADNLYIKVSKECCNEQVSSDIRAYDEISCAREKGNIIYIKSLYVGIINTFDIKTSDMYVKEGSKVKRGQVLGIISYLKIPITVEASIDGVLTKVFVKNNEMIDYGQVLFEITDN
jgi:acetyl-CoA carboxylase biotin carboxyl carrier protein